MGRVGIAIAAGAVFLVAAGCGSGAYTRTYGRISWAQGYTGPPPTAALASRAERVASRSRLVQRLTGAGATAGQTFVWLGSVSDPRVVEVTFALPRARRIDTVVPFAEIPPDAPSAGDCRRPYAPGWERLRAGDVTVVFVGVDVTLDRVADIDTDARHTVVSSVAGRPFPDCEEKQQ